MEQSPQIPSSDDDADPDVQSTPGGVTSELEEEIDDTGAEVGPDAAEHDEIDDDDIDDIDDTDD